MGQGKCVDAQQSFGRPERVSSCETTTRATDTLHWRDMAQTLPVMFWGTVEPLRSINLRPAKWIEVLMSL